MLLRAITGYVLLYIIGAGLLMWAALKVTDPRKRLSGRHDAWGWRCRVDGCRVVGVEPSEVQAARAYDRHYQREHYRPYLPAPRAHGTRRPA